MSAKSYMKSAKKKQKKQEYKRRLRAAQKEYGTDLQKYRSEKIKLQKEFGYLR